MEIENVASQEADDAALFAEMTAKEPPQQVVEPEAEPLFEPARQEAPKTTEASPEPPVPQENDQVKNLNAALREARQKQAESDRRYEEMLARFAASQPPPPPPPPAPDWYEDPKAFVQNEITPELRRQQEIMLYNSRLIAEARFGEDAVRAAQETFDSLAASRTLDPVEHAKVMRSPNPFAEVVQWHQRHRVISEVGTDPAAYEQKLRAKLLQDPDFRKEAMGAWQQQATAAPGQRSNPNIRLPSLSRVGAAALPSNDDAEMSEADLWKSATAPRR